MAAGQERWSSPAMMKRCAAMSAGFPRTGLLSGSSIDSSDFKQV